MRKVLQRLAASAWRRIPSVLPLVILLALPAPLGAAPCTYTVQRGDTLWRIAARNGITVGGILRTNPSITNPDLIRVGQQLQLPDCRAPSVSPPPPTPAPPPRPGTDFPDQPLRPLPEPPKDLLSALWQRAHDATINIRHPIEDPEFRGSGVVVGGDGRTFITAYHVIGDALNGEEVDRVAIGPFAGWRFTADVVATDPSIDLAVLRVREPDFPGFAVLPVGDSSQLQEGDAIYTFSYPGERSALVSGKGRYLTRVRTFHNQAALIVTSAGATFGSSGGPAVNMQGELVGVITGGVIGREIMKTLGYPELTRATLIVPIDAAAGLLRKAGIERPEP